jgi:hypothetical protein
MRSTFHTRQNTQSRGSDSEVTPKHRSSIIDIAPVQLGLRQRLPGSAAAHFVKETHRIARRTSGGRKSGVVGGGGGGGGGGGTTYITLARQHTRHLAALHHIATCKGSALPAPFPHPAVAPLEQPAMQSKAMHTEGEEKVGIQGCRSRTGTVHHDTVHTPEHRGRN